MHSTIAIGKQHKKQNVMLQNTFIFITITFKAPPSLLAKNHCIMSRDARD